MNKNKFEFWRNNMHREERIEYILELLKASNEKLTSIKNNKMSKTLIALYSGKIVQFLSPTPRFYKFENGKLYYTDFMLDNPAWNESSAKSYIFNNDLKWRIL